MEGNNFTPGFVRISSAGPCAELSPSRLDRAVTKSTPGQHQLPSPWCHCAPSMEFRLLEHFLNCPVFLVPHGTGPTARQLVTGVRVSLWGNMGSSWMSQTGVSFDPRQALRAWALWARLSQCLPLLVSGVGLGRKFPAPSQK